MRERPAARASLSRDERGVATVLAVGLLGMVLVVTLVAVAVAALVGARHRAETAADLGALAGAVAARDGSDACAAAARVSAANDGLLTACVVADRTVEVTVTVTTGQLLGRTWEVTGAARAGPAGSAVPARDQPTAAAVLLGEPASSTFSNATAPGLSSGWFWLPHFGDCTHDGQPSSQAQASIACAVARNQASAVRNPRSAKPAPPG